MFPEQMSSAALPKSMVQEEQTIRRWDGPEPVVGASGDWSREEAVEVGGEAEEGRPVPGKLEEELEEEGRGGGLLTGRERDGRRREEEEKEGIEPVEGT